MFHDRLSFVKRSLVTDLSTLVILQAQPIAQSAIELLQIIGMQMPECLAHQAIWTPT